jgi:hypothetical protein
VWRRQLRKVWPESGELLQQRVAERGLDLALAASSASPQLDVRISSAVRRLSITTTAWRSTTSASGGDGGGGAIAERVNNIGTADGRWEPASE